MVQELQEEEFAGQVVQELQEEELAGQVVQELQEEELEVKLCSAQSACEEEEEKTAVVRCDLCEDLLGEDCSKIHRKTRATGSMMSHR